MKRIIAGQIMMWGNLIGIAIGYHLYQFMNIESSFAGFLFGLIGAGGAVFNTVVAITMQIRGYKESNIVNLVD